MANNPFTLRLDPDTRERLTKAAAAANRPLATHAAMLVRLACRFRSRCTCTRSGT